ncbi:hypothetical protein [Paludisphaera borealis]|uniref:Uncharacterized protein n=1 Tax=Paludisphaera borealis TaxID=1387353 RepID=A0A1U7CY39_9BACT|nr:hypothetical protein [Paludisphaera borealis]APW63870.1 hypothetical protein BSF38_05456 [Paludisphaera borealis]
MHSIDWQCDESDDRVVIRGPETQVTFLRLGDRWIHHVSFGRRDSSDAALDELVSSEESDPRQDDPARVVSPVYQDLHRHTFAGDEGRGVCLLLTGRLFHHHFSAAVTVSTDPDREDAVIIDFDVADRCRAEVSSLAATYLVRLGSSELRDADSQSIVWTGRQLGEGVLTLQSDAGAILALAEAGRQSTRAQALARLAPDSFTHRLRYRWRWATTADSGRSR